MVLLQREQFDEATSHLSHVTPSRAAIRARCSTRTTGSAWSRCVEATFGDAVASLRRAVTLGPEPRRGVGRARDRALARRRSPPTRARPGAIGAGIRHSPHAARCQELAETVTAAGGTPPRWSAALSLLLALQGEPPREPTRSNLTVGLGHGPDHRPAGARSAVDSRPRPRRQASWLGLGRVALGPLVAGVVPDRETFQRWSRGRLPSWGAGMALPNAGLMLVRVDGGDATVTLRHELAHVALHRG